MPRLKLTLACGEYDRTRALLDGTVRPEGVDLNFLPLVPGETFWGGYAGYFQDPDDHLWEVAWSPQLRVDD